MALTPARLLPLLRCPLCPSHTLLHSPVTLRCGDTLCAEHARADVRGRCPLPSCTSAPLAPALAPHPQSGVGYYTAPPMPGAPSAADRARPGRADVTVSKILELAERAQACAPAYPPDADEHTDSEGDDGEPPRVDPEHDIDDMYLDPAPPAAEAVAGPSSAPASAVDTVSSPARDPRATRRPRSCSPDALSTARPRKRRRHLPPRRPPPEPQERTPAARFEKELLGELTCDICSQLFVQPVTAPCQHTFCAGCLHRSLDYNAACPICRDPLEYAYFQDHPCNKLVLKIILSAFRDVHDERCSAIEAEERDARLDTPVMIAQLSYPGMPTMLHFFEPRYRLMLRRCLATPNPRFGMIPPPRTAPSAAFPPALQAHAPPAHAPSTTGNEYGTMLEIRNVQMLPDGRAVVETWGAWRFRIVERGTLDGYVVARVERVDDWEEGDEELVGVEETRAGEGEGRGGQAVGRRAGDGKARTMAELMEVCHTFMNELREGTPWVVHRLNTNYVAMPTDPASFSFWMGALLPIDEHEKAKLLPIRSARLRLRLVVHWIEKLQSQWWFSGGCVVS
ncbi:LON-domain-containing protein [Rhodofomes roseus]|uniref:LON-domain-containing protein n=1 Tax=Rhodofomes roseus TaxID=34475 RepID=A0ABQ8KX17_9APHY|nr:LON-domain-containing protein [Rhodofomes roseus]KAH9843844.1 LON-domain-containing protein [Rhodofomes roseus]